MASTHRDYLKANIVLSSIYAAMKGRCRRSWYQRSGACADGMLLWTTRGSAEDTSRFSEVAVRSIFHFSGVSNVQDHLAAWKLSWWTTAFSRSLAQTKPHVTSSYPQQHLSSACSRPRCEHFNISCSRQNIRQTTPPPHNHEVQVRQVGSPCS